MWMVAIPIPDIRVEVAFREKLNSLVSLRDFSKHPKAEEYIESQAPLNVVKTGRRGAKTVATARRAARRFLKGRRQLYGAPTFEQLDTFWREIKRVFGPAVDAGLLHKNETERYIEREGTDQRIKAKTVYNADTLRGDWADDLYLDEWQLCDEVAWEEVGAPMLIDRDGTASFIFTPPSPRASGISRARDPRHATKMFEQARADTTGRWAAFQWTSYDNPYLSSEGLESITLNLSSFALRREIMAEDDEENPNQLIYRAFNHATQVIPPFALPAEWPRYVGHDFGGANPAATFWAQDPITGYFYLYEEYFPGAGLSPYEHVVKWKEMTAGLTVLTRKGGSHQEDEVRAAYTGQGWPIMEPRLRDVGVQIDRVRGMMEKNRIFVFNTCHRFLQEISTYLWKIDKDGRLTDEIYNKSAYHMMDSMRYILSDFPPERVTIEKVEPLTRRRFRNPNRHGPRVPTAI